MGEQATQTPAIGHQGEAVGFVHHQIAGDAAGVACLQAQGGHFGVEDAHKAVAADAQQSVGGHEGGLADVHRAAGAQREVGRAPVHIGRAAQHGLCRCVGHLDAVELVVEVHRQVAGGCFVHQLHGAQHQVAGAFHGLDHELVKARAAGDVDVAATVGGVEEDGVATRAGVDLGVAAAHDHGVGARAGAHRVVAQAHVDRDRAATAHKTVVAGSAGVAAHPGVAAGGSVVAEVVNASRGAVEELVVAGAAGNDAASGTALDQEAVVAQAAVEVEPGIHALADVERVVARAATAADGLDAVSAVALFHPQRAHDVFVALGVEFHRHAFVDDFVVFRLAITASGVAHVEHQRVANQAADFWWVGPRPQVAARDRNAHHRDAGGQVGAGGGDVDFAAEAGDGEVDGDEAEIEFEVQRTPHRRRKARLAAQDEAGTGVQVQRPHVDVDLDLAPEFEITVRIDIARHLHRGDVEEVERTGEFELEDIVDHAHATVEIDLKQEQVDLANQLEVEEGSAGQQLTLQGGVVEIAGVDAQRGARLNLQDGDVHLRLELHVQRKERLVIGIHANGRRTGHLNFTKGAQIQHHLHGHLDTGAVDLEVHRTEHADGANGHL